MIRPRLRWCAAAATVVSVLLALGAAPAAAHVGKTVGAYQLEVGWAHEPTYAGVENAVQLFVHDAAGKPLDDIGDGLKVQVIFSGQTSDPLALEPSFDPDTGLGTHGEFDAAMVPTRPGTYTFHFIGDINGQKVDESFTSSDQTFDSVKDPAAIEFPAKDPTLGALGQSVQRLVPRVGAAQQRASSAKSSASTATTLAVVALAVGVVLGGAGVLLALGARRRVAT
jgi:hypothetical protein